MGVQNVTPQDLSIWAWVSTWPSEFTFFFPCVFISSAFSRFVLLLCVRCCKVQNLRERERNGEDENRRGSVNNQETACCYPHSHQRPRSRGSFSFLFLLLFCARSPIFSSQFFFDYCCSGQWKGIAFRRWLRRPS